MMQERASSTVFWLLFWKNLNSKPQALKETTYNMMASIRIQVIPCMMLRFVRMLIGAGGTTPHR